MSLCTTVIVAGALNFEWLVMFAHILYETTRGSRSLSELTSCMRVPEAAEA